MNVDFTRVKPYGDTLNDGMMQCSFTLPVPCGEAAREAARQLAGKMGLDEPQIYHMKDLGEGYTYFIVYGKCRHFIDYTSIQVHEKRSSRMDFEEINRWIREKIGRKVIVIGACTGTDAHTVGIDAIINMKGYNGEFGLERYPEIEAYNLGSQVDNETLIAKALEVQADVILVSQVVTQKGIHITNLTQLIELLEAEGLRERFILICGGPRIHHQLALELGFDAGFGPGTVAPDVASYFVQEIVRRKR
ncbi:MAG: OAM dimerization domain-containing protein [Thermoactinomyces sp.]